MVGYRLDFVVENQDRLARAFAVHKAQLLS